MTNTAAPHVGVMLKLLRPLADELVLAVEDGPVPELADAAVVDRQAAFPHRATPEGTLAWLHEQCSMDWILRVDADEVPSASLLERLPDLVEARDLTHFWLQRRWLFPSRETYLDQQPWRPDYQLRMVRNEPELLRFPGTMHTSVEVDGPHRYLEEALYHADCLLQEREARERKAERYERLRPGMRVAGRPINDIYLPERWPAPRTASVPAPDRELLDHVFAGSPPPRRRRAVAPGAADPPADTTSYDGRLSIARGERTLTAGQRHVTFDVRVENLGTRSWPWGFDADPPIRLAYRWRAPDGDVVVRDGLRTPLPAVLPPGGSALVPVVVEPPRRPGRYILEIDLVHEHVRWFGCGQSYEVEVRSAPRVLLMGGYGPVRHVGDDAILVAHLHQLSELAPGLEPLVLGLSPPELEARFGQASGLGPYGYLLGGLDFEAGRFGAAMRFWLRAGLLLAAAHRFRRGKRPRGARREVLEEFADARALLAASAGSLASNFRFQALWPQLVTMLVAAALDVPVLVSGVTVGPVNGVVDRTVCARALRRARLISVRDRRASSQQLRRLRVPARLVREDVDPATALPPAPEEDVDQELARLGLDPAAGFALLSVRAVRPLSPGLDEWAGIARHLADRHGLRTVFVPMSAGGVEDDRALGFELAGRVEGLVVADPLPRDTVVAGLAARAAISLGTRYHAAVFAAAAGAPSVAFFADAYTRRKIEGLRDAAPAAVTTLPATAGLGAALAAADRALAGGRVAPMRPPHPLPAVELLAQSERNSWPSRDAQGMTGLAVNGMPRTPKPRSWRSS